MPRVFLMLRLFKCVPLSWVKRRSVFKPGIAGPPLQHLQGCLAVGLQHMYKPSARLLQIQLKAFYPRVSTWEERTQKTAVGAIWVSVGQQQQQRRRQAGVKLQGILLLLLLLVVLLLFGAASASLACCSSCSQTLAWGPVVGPHASGS
jgi:hypothetical protein